MGATTTFVMGVVVVIRRWSFTVLLVNVSQGDWCEGFLAPSVGAA